VTSFFRLQQVLYIASDNATGKLRKTIQRLPVKISLDTIIDVEKINYYVLNECGC
jgi:hypothetical protein